MLDCPDKVLANYTLISNNTGYLKIFMIMSNTR